MIKPLLVTLLIGTAVLVAACGQVVTAEPTRALLPVDAPTATRATPMQRSSSTQAAPATPVPDTVTPTVTPTPIVHVVQQGDTLQAIAFDFGVSVDALQRANGIENPQFLQIGQRLIIPVHQDPDQTTMDLLLPTPTPQPIQVQGTASYETPVGSLLVLGEVANTTAVTLTNVQVQVTLIDAAGEPLVDTNTFAPLDLLAPGARSPFRILFTTPPSDWVNYQVTVIRGQKAGALASGYVPISVVESEGGPAGPQFRVNGVVENVSAGRSAQSVDVVITTYDSEGTVTGFRQSALAPDTADGQLTPGGEMAFSLLLTTHGDVPADFAVTALGHAANGMTSGG